MRNYFLRRKTIKNFQRLVMLSKAGNPRIYQDWDKLEWEGKMQISKAQNRRPRIIICVEES